MKKIIGTTMSEEKVYAIVNDAHMLAHASVSEQHIAEAIASIDTALKPFQIEEHNLGRVIGETRCVSTTEEDVVFFACRKGRATESRLVSGREPEPTTKIVVGICKDDDGLMTVFTAFYGELSPKELSDPRLTNEDRPKAEAFWATHALIAE